MKKSFILVIILMVVIASCSKKTVPAEKSIDVAGLYGNNCAGCHGSDGTNGRSPNLAKTGLDKKGIQDIITNGHGHMPAFASRLTDKEINAVSNWVVSLKK